MVLNATFNNLRSDQLASIRSVVIFHDQLAISLYNLLRIDSIVVLWRSGWVQNVYERLTEIFYRKITMLLNVSRSRRGGHRMVVDL
jgi:hypothetical protein